MKLQEMTMHPVKLSDGEMELMRQARDKNDWSILPTFKLKYLYQRLVAFPRGDISAVREIGEQARKKWKKDGDELYEKAKEVFGG